MCCKKQNCGGVDPIASVVKDGEDDMVEEEVDNDDDNNIAVALEDGYDNNDCDDSSFDDADDALSV